MRESAEFGSSRVKSLRMALCTPWNLGDQAGERGFGAVEIEGGEHLLVVAGEFPVDRLAHLLDEAVGALGIEQVDEGAVGPDQGADGLGDLALDGAGEVFAFLPDGFPVDEAGGLAQGQDADPERGGGPSLPFLLGELAEPGDDVGVVGGDVESDRS